MATSAEKTNALNALKVYVFPTLVTILATLIWRDVSELRTDVKALLAQSNIDKTRIDNLQHDVQTLEQKILSVPKATSYFKEPSIDRYFLHKKNFEVEDYLPTFKKS